MCHGTVVKLLVDDGPACLHYLASTRTHARTHALASAKISQGRSGDDGNIVVGVCRAKAGSLLVASSRRQAGRRQAGRRQTSWHANTGGPPAAIKQEVMGHGRLDGLEVMGQGRLDGLEDRRPRV